MGVPPTAFPRDSTPGYAEQLAAIHSSIAAARIFNLIALSCVKECVQLGLIDLCDIEIGRLKKVEDRRERIGNCFDRGTNLIGSPP